MGTSSVSDLRSAKRKQQQQAVIEFLREGTNRLAACEAAGLPRRTFYNWLGAEPAFRARVEEAECQSIRTIESAVYAAGLKSEQDPRYLRSALAWLMSKAGWRRR
jgi:hypothetical protein